MKEKIIQWLLVAVVFLLPLQTRWIFHVFQLGNGVSEYGQFSLYVNEILIFLVVLLRGRPQYPVGTQWVIQGWYFLLGVVFVSLGFSSFFSVGLAFTLHLLFAFGLFSILCDQRTNLKKVVMAFISGLFLPALLGWWQVLSGGSPDSTWFGLALKDAQVSGVAVVETLSGRMMRAYGSLPHPNIFGGYLAVGLMLLAWLVRFIHSRRLLWLSVVPVVLLSATLIVTFSRSAWIGLTIGFLVLISLMLFRRRVPSKRAIPIMILGVITIFSTLFIFQNQLFSRLLAQGDVESISVTERTSQYGLFDDVFFINPLFGVGPSAYPFVLEQIQPGEDAWAYQPIHNAFLLILSELGIVGGLALLYLLLRIDQVSARAAKTGSGMLGLCLSITLGVIGLLDHYLWSLWPGLALVAFSMAIIIRWSSISVVLDMQKH